MLWVIDEARPLVGDGPCVCVWKRALCGNTGASFELPSALSSRPLLMAFAAAFVAISEFEYHMAANARLCRCFRLVEMQPTAATSIVEIAH